MNTRTKTSGRAAVLRDWPEPLVSLAVLRSTPWADADLGLGNAENAELARALVGRWARDLDLLDVMGKQVPFARSVAQQVLAGKQLTIPQLRGAVNVIGGAIKRQRALAYAKPYADVRYRRGARTSGPACVICGDELTTEVQRSRGCGDTCYLRLLGA
jgi:hypothetical protein